jgi:hypothetical protein
VDEREWALLAYQELTRGNTVQVRPRGDSMRERIRDGDLVTLEPCWGEELVAGDVVLARVRGHLLVLHQVLEREAGRFLIGNSEGRADGWVSAQAIFGRVTKVERGTGSDGPPPFSA